MGGRFGSVLEDAKCVAGWMKPRCIAPTVMYGMPYAPPPPKSAWRKPPLPLARMFEMNADEFGCSGAAEMSVFHGLFDGNTEQPPIVGPPPPGGTVVVVVVVLLVVVL